MKGLSKIIVVLFIGFAFSPAANSQNALLANSDGCATFVALSWECSPCAALVTTFHFVPAYTQTTVAAPCAAPGPIWTAQAWLYNAQVIYTGQGPVDVKMGLMCLGTTVSYKSKAAVACSGLGTHVDVSAHPGLFIVDINGF